MYGDVWADLWCGEGAAGRQESLRRTTKVAAHQLDRGGAKPEAGTEAFARAAGNDFADAAAKEAARTLHPSKPAADLQEESRNVADTWATCLLVMVALPIQ